MRNTKIRSLVYCAVFVAIPVLISSFSIYFGPSIRLSLSAAITIFGGIILGPWLGCAAGAASDLVGLLVKPISNVFSPGFTLTAALYGLLGGFLYRTRNGAEPGIWQITGSTCAIQALCSGILNTLWISMLTETPFSVLFVTRLPVTAAGAAFYSAILYVLIRARDRIIPRTPIAGRS